jgi:ThiF family protein
MKTYLMIGAGGTGTHLIGPLLPYLDGYHRDLGEEWQLVVIDGDNYDIGNQSRQLFDAGFVSANKAQAMATMYNRYPVIAIPQFIGADDLKTMFDEGDTVFICADNHSIRALVQDRALELNDCVVINAGNELADGNVQLWVRQNGENVTPKLTYMHPEIVFTDADDRAAMTCQQAARLPGGGQLILANQQAASWMMAAIWRYHTGAFREGWTELQFDLAAGTVHHINMRERRNWAL